MRLPIGSRIGVYQIVSLIGAGGRVLNWHQELTAKLPVERELRTP